MNIVYHYDTLEYIHERRQQGMEKLYTPQEVADLLKVDLRTVYRWIREGKLAALKAGSQWRIEERALEGFLSQKDK